MSSDTMSIAGVKNRLSRSFLEMELNSLDRQRKSDLRSSSNELKKFKNKYSKLDLLVEGKVNYGSDVRMYDTHYPGFCYKRNGEYRIPVALNNPPVMNFNELHQLLFTDGEVDIEKVLCLHLLAVHKSESVMSPPRENSTKLRDRSPVERLIERSKKKKAEDSLTKVLPTYVLDVDSMDSTAGKTASEQTLIRDGRLAARLFINEKIVQLIETVLIALQQANPKKVEDLVEMASDPNILRKILEKPHIQEFMDFLRNQMLISSCESFRLSQPFRAKFSTLSIQTVRGGLENLVKLIRRNILQTPKTTWTEKVQRNQSNASSTAGETKTETPKREASITEQSRQASSKFTKKDFIAKNREALNKVRKLEYDDSENENVPSPRRRSKNSSVEERLVKSSTLFDSDFRPNRRKSSDVSYSIEDVSLNPEMLAEIIKKKVETAYHKDLSYTNRQSLLSSIQQPLIEENPHETDNQDIPKKEPSKSKYPFIKKTTCEACSAKWQQPLPTPKTPLIKRNCIPTLDQDTYKEVATESTHRISQIIDKEYNKLRPRQNSKNGIVNSNRSSRNSVRESFSKKYSADAVDLSEMDLARIRQEIKEKETQKKLDKFLHENK